MNSEQSTQPQTPPQKLVQHWIATVQGQEQPRPESATSTDALAALGILSLELERARGALQVLEASYQFGKRAAEEIGQAAKAERTSLTAELADLPTSARSVPC